MDKVILFNPRSTKSKHRIPNSILKIASSIEGKYDYIFVDSNLEQDEWTKFEKYLSTGEFKYFCFTVMPGSQHKLAISFTKNIKELYKNDITIWEGCFLSNQKEAVINSV